MNKPKKTPLFFLYHIQESIAAIESYMITDKNEFLNNRMLRMAVLHELTIIGEAANKIDDDFKVNHPEVSWRDLTDFRNVLAHHYWAVNMEIVWNVIHDQDKLPQVKKSVLLLIDELENNF